MQPGVAVSSHFGLSARTMWVPNDVVSLDTADLFLPDAFDVPRGSVPEVQPVVLPTTGLNAYKPNPRCPEYKVVRGPRLDNTRLLLFIGEVGVIRIKLVAQEDIAPAAAMSVIHAMKDLDKQAATQQSGGTLG